MAREQGNILVVDDEDSIRDILATLLTAEGHRCQTASDAHHALELLSQRPFDLVLTDIVMPGMNGLDLLKTLVSGYPDLAVVMVTSANDVNVAVDALTSGAYDYVVKPFDLKRVSLSVQRALERRRLILENRRYQLQLEQRVQEQVREIQSLYRAERQRTEELKQALAEVQLTYNATLEALLNALDFRDNETQGHSRRVVEYTLVIAREMGIQGDMLKTIEMGAMLHDIGKIGVPDAVLRKPDKLTPEEWVEMRKHVIYGYNMIKDIPFLREPALIVLHHQEQYDGNGYPQGLKGEEIVIGARIFAVADTYDAMTSDRPYRKALNYEEARDEIVRCSGTQFDPQVVRAFLRVPKARFLEIAHRVNRLFGGNGRQLALFREPRAVPPLSRGDGKRAAAPPRPLASGS